jgi:hypothetical protein
MAADMVVVVSAGEEVVVSGAAGQGRSCLGGQAWSCAGAPVSQTVHARTNVVVCCRRNRSDGTNWRGKVTTE